MKNRNYLLNTLLAAVVAVALLAIILVRTFLPNFVIPKPGIPNLMLLSLIALLLDHYLAPGAQRCYICIPVFALVTFGLLPWIAGYVPAGGVWKLAIAGAAVFTAATFLFSSICERLSSGPASKAAPIVSAIGLYFAAQCLAGIFI